MQDEVRVGWFLHTAAAQGCLVPTVGMGWVA